MFDPLSGAFKKLTAANVVFIFFWGGGDAIKGLESGLIFNLFLFCI